MIAYTSKFPNRLKENEMTVVSVGPQEDFVRDMVRIHADDDDRTLIAEIANPQFMSYADNMWQIPEGVIYAKHNTAKSAYGDDVYLVNILVKHFHAHNTSVAAGRTVYTGRTAVFSAYDEPVDFDNDADLPTNPPHIDKLRDIDVIIVHTIVRDKDHSDRIVESFKNKA